jgi:hypothetical protein
MGGNDNAPERVLNAYRRWFGRQIVRVGQWLTDNEIARVLTTPRYWSVNNLGTSTFRLPRVAEFVRHYRGREPSRTGYLVDLMYTITNTDIPSSGSCVSMPTDPRSDDPLLRILTTPEVSLLQTIWDVCCSAPVNRYPRGVARKSTKHPSNQVRLIDMAVLDEAGNRYEFERDFGWNQTLEEALAVTSEPRVFIDSFGSMRESARRNVERDTGSDQDFASAGVYRSGSRSIISLRT